MLRFLTLALVSGILVFTPVAVSAASVDFFGPIVPEECNCKVEEGSDRVVASAPDWGCVLQTVQNAVRFAVSIGVLIVVLIMAYAGILWITSPMNAHNREEGRTMLINAVIGLVITLAAWLIVDFVMKALYNDTEFGPWNKILGTNVGAVCLGDGKDWATQDPGKSTIDPGLHPINRPSLAVPLPCSHCVEVDTAKRYHHKVAPDGCNLPVGQSCQINDGLHLKLETLATRVSGWQVTEMWPPTRNHGADCHKVGTCTDISFEDPADRNNKGKIYKLMVEIAKLGMIPIYEFKTPTACAQFLKTYQGIKIGDTPIANGVTVMGSNAVGDGHFSVYVSTNDFEEANHSIGCD